MKSYIPMILAAVTMCCSAPQMRTADPALQQTPRDSITENIELIAQHISQYSFRQGAREVHIVFGDELIAQHTSQYSFRQEEREVNIVFGDVNLDRSRDLIMLISRQDEVGLPEVELHDFFADGSVDRVIQREQILGTTATREVRPVYATPSAFETTIYNAVSCILGSCDHPNSDLSDMLESMTQSFDQKLSNVKMSLQHALLASDRNIAGYAFTIGNHEARVRLTMGGNGVVVVFGSGNVHAYTAFDEFFDGNIERAASSCEALEDDPFVYRLIITALDDMLVNEKNTPDPEYARILDTYMGLDCSE